MKALLVRVAVDQAYGGWNSPVAPSTGRFVYVPIPEGTKTVFHPGCDRPYALVAPALERFGSGCTGVPDGLLRLPEALTRRSMHLDPDFDHLTYGDNGDRRGAGIVGMGAGDLLAFYAGLRPIAPCGHRLLYAIVGLYVVDQVVPASAVPDGRWDENAHTRKATRGAGDIIVRARPGVSGRLESCIPIGELRDGVYRVRRDLLAAWGGLSVKDGFIQRSAVPPAFLDPGRFYRWFLAQSPRLTARNNAATPGPVTATRPNGAVTAPVRELPLPGTAAGSPPVFLIHLRRPRTAAQNPNEARDDPFWEFGSFGCTGCHSSNLFHPRNAAKLRGARLGFVKGGQLGSRLVLLTPPVTVTEWPDRCEARWTPAAMPFRYEHAPVLAWNDRPGNFPLIERLARSANSTAEGGLSSRFRSRATPLTVDQAAELVAVYDRLRGASPADAIATSYQQALPSMPPRVDTMRQATYQRRIRELENGIELPTREASPDSAAPVKERPNGTAVDDERASRQRRNRNAKKHPIYGRSTTCRCDRNARCR